jgi:hypothetical protein
MGNIDQVQFQILSKRLSILLGFSDGVDDVLENLLTIESRAVSENICVLSSCRVGVLVAGSNNDNYKKKTLNRILLSYLHPTGFIRLFGTTPWV